jgi:hypothetical protein
MRNFKVVSPPEMLGIRTVMDENELIQILGGGGEAVHISLRWYRMLADSFVKMVESQKSTFAGGKIGREEDEEEEEEGIVNFHRRRHEWLYNVVSGAGGWKPSQTVKVGGQLREEGRAGRGVALSGTGGAG